MFIKWREENRPLTDAEKESFAAIRPSWAPHRHPVHRLYAYLAQSKRREGKPRQTVLYLGSIPVSATQDPANEDWRRFWYKVHCSLCLARVPFSVFHHARSEIGRRVIEPSLEDLSTIVIEEYQNHPRWHKDYETVGKALQKGSEEYFLLG